MKRTFWRPAVVIGLVTALVGAPSSALAAEPPALSAPVHTTAVWVDLESDASRSGVRAIEVRAAGQTWATTSVAATPFGATAQAPAAPGALELRVAVSAAVYADVVVTFVDASGLVLDSVVVRDVRLAAPTAGAKERWTNWADFETAPHGGDGASDGNSSGGGGGDSSSGPLALTGGVAPALWIVGSAIIAVIAGAALIIARRRRSNNEGDS
ncbi:hypothetical protein JOD62_000227 [Microbacterium keratanolyticum]|uniref:hypothetical protein n=1 Tax=Microbacterium keratanolyticum TaxID=67574 RepID=UPI0019584A3C|nr:hypothetical protein [Microbacterium keratanolyticum]MBM7467679.1 hypothetical protein [Microbacterium keratanolyticum]